MRYNPRTGVLDKMGFEPRVEENDEREVGEQLAEAQMKQNEANPTPPYEFDYCGNAGIAAQNIGYKPSPKRYDSLFARLEKEQYQLDDIMNRRAKVEELTKLLYKHSEVGRIFDLIRELGL